MLKKRQWLLTAALFLAGAFWCLQAPLQACPFCTQGKGPTLLDDYHEAKLVVLGTFATAKQDLKGEFEGGTTLFKIAHVFKDHDIRKEKMEITLPIYRKPTDAQFVLFCDVFKGTPDPYRGVQVTTGGELVKYLKGAIKLTDKSATKRLEYCFDFLNSKDSEVSMDAYREFANAAYKDYKDLAEHFDADKLVEWLEDPETPPFRYGLYASLLGHCGKTKHLDVLKSMLADPKKRDSSGIDGMFAGYVFLLHKHNKHKEGLDFLRGIIGDTEQGFIMRWTALKTFRFIWETRPDIFTKQEIKDGVALGLKHKDMADFAIEDLRKWQCWDMTPQVLALFGKSSHKAKVIQRSILRFAIQAPTAEAKAFIAEEEKRDPELVKDLRELLELEKGIGN